MKHRFGQGHRATGSVCKDSGKHGFTSRSEAERARKRRRDKEMRYNAMLQTYKCRYCHKYHLGHGGDQIRPMRGMPD